VTASADPVAFSDPVYREAVVDLLAAVGYGEISAFERLAEDAKLAPSLEDKLVLATFASQQIGKVASLRTRLEELGADPFAAMESFRDGFEAFHAHTAPSDWWEGLVKAYVGDGLANDFYREIAAFLDPDTRDLVLTSLEDTGHAGFVVERVRAGIAEDPRLAGRLALWGRRLVGEAISQTQHVLADRDSLTRLLVAGTGDLSGVGALIERITDKHAERMRALGLDS
jgi:catechol 2,3-dioxygenase-like lactoylglutathione lyase family enzyme